MYAAMRVRFDHGEKLKLAHEVLWMLSCPRPISMQRNIVVDLSSLLPDSSYNIDTVKLQLSHDADVQTMNQAGRTTLNYAASG